MRDAGRWGWWFAPRPVEAGEEQRFSGVPVPGKQGLHAATRLLGALPFARSGRLCRVWLEGQVVEQDGQLAATCRRVGWVVEVDAILRAAVVEWTEAALGNGLLSAMAHHQAASEARDRGLALDDAARDLEWKGESADHRWAEAAGARAEADAHEAAAALIEDTGTAGCQRAVERLVHAASLRDEPDPTDAFERDLRRRPPREPTSAPSPATRASAPEPEGERELAALSVVNVPAQDRRAWCEVRRVTGPWQEGEATPLGWLASSSTIQRRFRDASVASVHPLTGGGVFVRRTTPFELNRDWAAWSALAGDLGMPVALAVGADVAPGRFMPWYRATVDIEEAEVLEARGMAALPIGSSKRNDRLAVAIALLRPAVDVRFVRGDGGATVCVEAPLAELAEHAFDLVRTTVSDPVLAWSPDYAIRTKGCTRTPETIPHVPRAPMAVAPVARRIPEDLPEDVAWELRRLTLSGIGPVWVAISAAAIPFAARVGLGRHPRDLRGRRDEARPRARSGGACL
ncbi:MAG: hypothetical protein AB8I08_18130 [Sandaracinaceae bacterium]